ncbi:unnamed protein product [Amoebophrya sp. A25]|nr:unnamed protein product [Amoebophrya sp. A25]|eukprot:GSA25T00022981001.1
MASGPIDDIEDVVVHNGGPFSATNFASSAPVNNGGTGGIANGSRMPSPSSSSASLANNAGSLSPINSRAPGGMLAAAAGGNDGGFFGGGGHVGHQHTLAGGGGGHALQALGPGGISSPIIEPPLPASYHVFIWVTLAIFIVFFSGVTLLCVLVTKRAKSYDDEELEKLPCYRFWANLNWDLWAAAGFSLGEVLIFALECVHMAECLFVDPKTKGLVGACVAKKGLPMLGTAIVTFGVIFWFIGILTSDELTVDVVDDGDSISNVEMAEQRMSSHMSRGRESHILSREQSLLPAQAPKRMKFPPIINKMLQMGELQQPDHALDPHGGDQDAESRDIAGEMDALNSSANGEMHHEEDDMQNPVDGADEETALLLQLPGEEGTTSRGRAARRGSTNYTGAAAGAGKDQEGGGVNAGATGGRDQLQRSNSIKQGRQQLQITDYSRRAPASSLDDVPRPMNNAGNARNPPNTGTSRTLQLPPVNGRSTPLMLPPPGRPYYNSTGGYYGQGTGGQMASPGHHPGPRSGIIGGPSNSGPSAGSGAPRPYGATSSSTGGYYQGNKNIGTGNAGGTGGSRAGGGGASSTGMHAGAQSFYPGASQHGAGSYYASGHHPGTGAHYHGGGPHYHVHHGGAAASNAQTMHHNPHPGAVAHPQPGGAPGDNTWTRRHLLMRLNIFAGDRTKRIAAAQGVKVQNKKAITAGGQGMFVNASRNPIPLPPPPPQPSGGQGKHTPGTLGMRQRGIPTDSLGVGVLPSLPRTSVIASEPAFTTRISVADTVSSGAAGSQHGKETNYDDAHPDAASQRDHKLDEHSRSWCVADVSQALEDAQKMTRQSIDEFDVLGGGGGQEGRGEPDASTASGQPAEELQLGTVQEGDDHHTSPGGDHQSSVILVQAGAGGGMEAAASSAGSLVVQHVDQHSCDPEVAEVERQQMIEIEQQQYQQIAEEAGIVVEERDLIAIADSHELVVEPSNALGIGIGSAPNTAGLDLGPPGASGFGDADLGDFEPQFIDLDQLQQHEQERTSGVVESSTGGGASRSLGTSTGAQEQERLVHQQFAAAAQQYDHSYDHYEVVPAPAGAGVSGGAGYSNIVEQHVSPGAYADHHGGPAGQHATPPAVTYVAAEHVGGAPGSMPVGVVTIDGYPPSEHAYAAEHGVAAYATEHHVVPGGGAGGYAAGEGSSHQSGGYALEHATSYVAEHHVAAGGVVSYHPGTADHVVGGPLVAQGASAGGNVVEFQVHDVNVLLGTPEAEQVVQLLQAKENIIMPALNTTDAANTSPGAQAGGSSSTGGGNAGSPGTLGGAGGFIVDQSTGGIITGESGMIGDYGITATTTALGGESSSTMPRPGSGQQLLGLGEHDVSQGGVITPLHPTQPLHPITNTSSTNAAVSQNIHTHQQHQMRAAAGHVVDQSVEASGPFGLFTRDDTEAAQDHVVEQLQEYLVAGGAANLASTTSAAVADHQATSPGTTSGTPVTSAAGVFTSSPAAQQLVLQLPPHHLQEQHSGTQNHGVGSNNTGSHRHAEPEQQQVDRHLRGRERAQHARRGRRRHQNQEHLQLNLQHIRGEDHDDHDGTEDEDEDDHHNDENE